MPKKTRMLIILDGWGIGIDEPTNAVLMADTPFLDRLQASYPSTRLRCSGQDVGLPDGIMGNSEVQPWCVFRVGDVLDMDDVLETGCRHFNYSFNEQITFI